MIEIAGVRNFAWTRWNIEGSRFLLLIAYAMRELPKTPELRRDQQQDRAENRHVECREARRSTAPGSRAARRLCLGCPGCPGRSARTACAWPCASTIGCHGCMPSAKFEYASAKIRIVRIRATDVRGMIEAGRCVSCAACEIDSKPDERNDRERNAEHQLVRRRPVHLHVVHEQLGLEREQEAEKEDRRFAQHVERGNEAVERRAFAHADDVEQRRARRSSAALR